MISDLVGAFIPEAFFAIDLFLRENMGELKCRVRKGFALGIAKIRQRRTNYSRQLGPKTRAKWSFLTKNSAKTLKTPV